MNSGNKPGQRTWYVGGGDEVPEETTAFETQSKVEEVTSEEQGEVVETPQEPDSELPTDGIPMTSSKDEETQPETSNTADEADFHGHSELEHTVADLAATPAFDDGSEQSYSSDSSFENISEGESVDGENAEDNSLKDEIFDSEQGQPDTDDAAVENDLDSVNSSSEFARRSVVEQLQTPIDEEDKENTAVHRQSLLDKGDDASEDDLSWKSTNEEAIEIKKKRSQIDEAIFEGATVRPTVPSRGAAHMWSLVLSLILVPVAWYLLWDAGTRFMMAQNAQWKTGVLDWLAISELVGACVSIFVLVLVARWSSLGAFITGVLVLAAGVPFIALPGLTAERIDPLITALENGNPFTGNIAHHLVWSGGTGFFVMTGVALIGLGFVSHGARRKGRKDFLAKRQVEREKRRRGVDSKN